MAKWKVDGADRETGVLKSVGVEAADRDEAASKGVQAGLFVSEVSRVDVIQPSPQPPPVPEGNTRPQPLSPSEVTQIPWTQVAILITTIGILACLWFRAHQPLRGDRAAILRGYENRITTFELREAEIKSKIQEAQTKGNISEVFEISEHANWLTSHEKSELEELKRRVGKLRADGVKD